MKLIIKQKLLSWFETYNVYDEQDNIMYVIKGELSWGHKLRIYDKDGNELGMIVEELLHLLARFNLIVNNEKIGQIIQKFKLINSEYDITGLDWKVQGNFWSTNFSVVDKSENEIMSINRKLFKIHDTYVIDVVESKNALYSLMIGVTLDIMMQKSSTQTGTTISV